MLWMEEVEDIDKLISDVHKFDVPELLAELLEATLEALRTGNRSNHDTIWEGLSTTIHNKHLEELEADCRSEVSTLGDKSEAPDSTEDEMYDD